MFHFLHYKVKMSKIGIQKVAGCLLNNQTKHNHKLLCSFKKSFINKSYPNGAKQFARLCSLRGVSKK